MTRLRKHSRTCGIVAVLACILASTQGNAQGNDLIKASGDGDLPRVKALLAAGSDVNAKRGDGVTALMAASATGHLEVVRALLAAPYLLAFELCCCFCVCAPSAIMRSQVGCSCCGSRMLSRNMSRPSPGKGMCANL